MSIRRFKIAAVAVPMAFALTACGGGGDRPSADEIADAIKGGDVPTLPQEVADSMPDGVVDCIAEALEKSDVSDETLRALVDGDEDYEGSDKDAEALSGLADDAAECATSAE
ncbi:hypothetical protein [Nocardioides sp. R-C-SC26]|uniref:hypothetical protein n=1 Tax=Nocardioides sp. R-C-SC26 TaxID=2870414 RepID=UPI001E2DB818|nr:hypothetical protein [Nocardioides sp. R-C-SC26]